MTYNENTIAKKEGNGYQLITVLIMFLAGLLNSSDYLKFMGYSILTQLITMLLYGLIVLMIMVIIVDFLYHKKKLHLPLFQYPYWIILAIGIILKLIILFIQSPFSFIPGGGNFNFFLTHMMNLLLIIILTLTIRSIRYIKVVIWAFGIGASFSAIIPFLFFPEMIGSRTSLINGYTFTGAFWNSAVISFISVAWLLIALSILQKSKLKRIALLILFILIVLAGLAGLSRATLLSLCVSGFVYLVVSKNFVKYLKTIIVLTLLFFILISFFQEAINNFEQRLDRGINISEESRVTIWKDYIEDIPDYFLLGELQGNYKKYSITEHGTHSAVLNWLTQFGIIALVGFIVLLIGVLNSIKTIYKKQSKHAAAALYAWLVAYLSIVMVNETGFKDLTVFGGIGIILAWGNVVKNTKNLEALYKSHN